MPYNQLGMFFENVTQRCVAELSKLLTLGNSVICFASIHQSRLLSGTIQKSSLLHPSFKHSVPHYFLHLEDTKYNRMDGGKNEMLTRPRTHVKSYLNFQRLKNKQFIPVFLLNAWYLLLHLQPAQKTVMLCGLKMLSRSGILYKCTVISKKKKKKTHLQTSSKGERQVGSHILGPCCLVKSVNRGLL